MFTRSFLVIFVSVFSSLLSLQKASAELFKFEVDESLSVLQAAYGLGTTSVFPTQTSNSDLAGISGHIYADITKEGVRIIGSDLNFTETEGIVPDEELTPHSSPEGDLPSSPANFGYQLTFSTSTVYYAIRNFKLSLSSRSFDYTPINNLGEFTTIGTQGLFFYVNSGQIDAAQYHTSNLVSQNLGGIALSNVKQSGSVPAGFEFLKTGLYLKGESRDTLYVPFYVSISPRQITGHAGGPSLTLLANLVARRAHPEASDVEFTKLSDDFYYKDSYIVRYADTSNHSAALIFYACAEKGASISRGLLYPTGPLVIPVTTNSPRAFQDDFGYCNNEIEYGGGAFFSPVVIGNQPSLWQVSCVNIDGTVKRSLNYNPYLYPDYVGTSWEFSTPTPYYTCEPRLPGDYNRDGCVNIADFPVYQNTLGQTVSPAGSGADGNLNGVVDHGDYTVFRDNYGTCQE